MGDTCLNERDLIDKVREKSFRILAICIYSQISSFESEYQKEIGKRVLTERKNKQESRNYCL